MLAVGDVVKSSPGPVSFTFWSLSGYYSSSQGNSCRIPFIHLGGEVVRGNVKEMTTRRHGNAQVSQERSIRSPAH